MITSTIKQLPKSTMEVEINIPWDNIKDTYEKVLKELANEVEIKGFRKGTAPSKLVEKQVGENKVYEQVIKKIIPAAYAQALKEHNLTAITSPKIELLKAAQNSDWLVKATVSTKPKINLKNYKDKIRELKKSKVKIWTPGSKDKETEQKKLSIDDIVGALISTVEVELSDLLITQEANRLLSDLVDQTRQVGLTIEQYLLSKGKTNEQLRAEYAQTAQKNLTVEFALAQIADQEQITVEKKDIDDLLAKVKDEKEKEKMVKDTYYLAHLIRQQKTLDFLNNL